MYVSIKLWSKPASPIKSEISPIPEDLNSDEAMAAVKLTYLKYKGRAELIRFILAEASIKFEDIRLEAKEWTEKMPGEVGDKTLATIILQLLFYM